MSEVHMVLQGKGGCGKSFVAFLLTQYLRERHAGQEVIAIDTDPVNPTLSRYARLHAEFIPLRSDDKNSVEAGDFDFLFNYFAAGQIYVVDVGSSAYLPMINFLDSEGHALEALQDLQLPLIIHAPVCGGALLNDTCAELRRMMARFAGVSFVAWLNPFFGRGRVMPEGRSFADYEINTGDGRLRVIELPAQAPSTDGKVLRGLLEGNLTFWDFDAENYNQHKPLLNGQSAQFIHLKRIELLRRAFYKAIDEGWQYGAA